MSQQTVRLGATKASLQNPNSGFNSGESGATEAKSKNKLDVALAAGWMGLDDEVELAGTSSSPRSWLWGSFMLGQREQSAWLAWIGSLLAVANFRCSQRMKTLHRGQENFL